VAEFSKVTLKNVDKGPRGVNTKDGTVVADPGQTVEVEANAAEVASATEAGWFVKVSAVSKPAAVSGEPRDASDKPQPRK
jgi:hypothetical protein